MQTLYILTQLKQEINLLRNKENLKKRKKERQRGRRIGFEVIPLVVIISISFWELSYLSLGA